MQLALSKSSALAGLLGLAVACLSAPRPAFPSAQTPAPAPQPALGRGLQPARLALLVGVEHYAPSSGAGVPNLEGCRADVESVRETLIARFGFAKEDVRVLLDEQATHENIVRAWREWLVGRAGPGTEVVFWFSGHGARTPDASGRKGAEIAGLDQTILAYDSRAAGEDGSYDISDDELYSLRLLLAQKTERLFAVIDSCHSASALRGLPKGALPRVRAADVGKQPLDPKRLAAFWPAVETDFVDDGDPRRAQAPPYAQISACSEGQNALEYSWNDEGGRRRTQGALSFFLGQALAHARPGATYREVADEAAALLMRQISGQTPCYEGALDRRLFDASFEDVPKGILARVQADGRLALAAGSLVGLARGAELRLEDAARAVIGRASIDDAWATHAVASWIGKAPANLPGALRAFEELRPAGGPDFALFVDDPSLALPARPDVARIDTARPDAYLLQRSGDALTLFAPGGIAIWRNPAGAKLAPAELAGALDPKWRAEMRQHALEQLAHGTLGLSARFRSPTPKELEELGLERSQDRVRSAAIEPAPKVAGSVFDATGRLDAPGEVALAILEVSNESKEDLFLYVLSVMESHEINVVCPDEANEDFVLRPGEMRTVRVDVSCAPDWPLERPLRDHYVVIGTPRRSDFRPYESRPTVRGAGEELQMPAILSAAIEPRTTRGLGLKVKVDADAFGLTTLDLLVRRP